MSDKTLGSLSLPRDILFSLIDDEHRNVEIRSRNIYLNGLNKVSYFIEKVIPGDRYYIIMTSTIYFK